MRQKLGIFDLVGISDAGRRQRMFSVFKDGEGYIGSSSTNLCRHLKRSLLVREKTAAGGFYQVQEGSPVQCRYCIVVRYIELPTS